MVKGIGIKPDARFFIIHNLTSMVKKGTVLLFLRGGQVSYVVPHPKKGKHTALRRCFGVVVRVRLTDALPLTESVVEDAHRYLNGTVRPFTDGRRHKTLFT